MTQGVEGVTMFEKEAEEYAKGLCKTCKVDVCRYSKIKTCVTKESLKQAYLAGAELGYNKAFVEADKNLKAIVTDFNKANERLIKAKELIGELISSLSVVGECEEEECELLNRAEEFISEVEK